MSARRLGIRRAAWYFRLIHTENTPSGGSPAAQVAVFEIMLEGEFDLSEKARLSEAFAIPKSAPIVALNLAKATYIDSTVLQCMVELEKATRKRGARLVLSGASSAVLRLLSVSSLDRFFEVDPDFANTVPADGVRTLTLVSSVDSV